MSNPSLVLLHPPSVMDFRERSYLHWPISNTVATSPVFEYYPLGFLTLMSHLEPNGFPVKIINMAVKMAKSKSFSPAEAIKKLRPLAFGIDLHWAAHADGAFELAALCKQIHPDIPVILGGLTASYFHEEAIRDPNIDFVMRGDSTEEPVLQLMRSLEKKQSPRDIPNLTWKEDGAVRVNPLSYQPEVLDIKIDYRLLMRHMIRERDLRGNLITGYQWPAFCFNLSLWCRGCKYRCVTCGGNNWALGREKLAYRPPEAVAEELAATQSLTPFHVGLPGDVRMGDWRALFAQLKEKKVRRVPGLELFHTADEEFFKAVVDLGQSPELAMSPESHDETVRRAYGRAFANDALEKDITSFLGMGGKVRLFFMVGLPHQDVASVRGTLKYCEQLFDRYSKYPNHFDITISVLGPFVDPGAPAFVEPEKHGYRIFTRTLADHRAAMRQLHWKDVLGFETDAMDRAAIADLATEASERLCQLRRAFGSLKPKHAEDYLQRLEQTRPPQGVK